MTLRRNCLYTELWNCVGFEEYNFICSFIALQFL